MSADRGAAAADYLAGRRARGFRLAGYDELLGSFLDRLEAGGVAMITAADALAFAQQRPGSQRRHQQVLSVIEGFAAYLHSTDPTAAELIPPGLIRAPKVRRIPYLYTNDQVSSLMSAAAALSPVPRAATFLTLIGMLTATGLRSGEALALDDDDIDWDRGALHVTGKNRKQRIVPVHPTTLHALADYQHARAAKPPGSGALLVSTTGNRLHKTSATSTFRSLTVQCQLEDRPGCGLPRLHDLRHTFAVNTLIDALNDGADVDARVALLADYLGHVDPTGTYWYLTATPELLRTVSERGTAYAGRRP